MAKGAYIGVGGKARKIRKGYIGVNMQIPVYATEDVSVTASNISDYFNVVNSPYYFAGSGNVFSSNNQGVAGSKAVTMLGAKADMPNISFQYSWSTEANYDKFTLQVAGKNIENAVSGVSTTKTFTGSLAEGQVIMFQYEKDNSQDKNDDLCKFWDMAITTQVQTGSETRPIARKIKKAYIGIGGKARPCWSGGELAYYGTVTPFDEESLAQPAATAIGNYALFGGGSDGGIYRNSVYAYNASLTRTMPTALSQARHQLAATTVGEYALFGGGWTSGSARSNVVDAYNTSLTRTIPTALSAARSVLSATTVGNYALFGGGYYSRGVGYDTVDAYNASLTRTNPTALSSDRYNQAATTVGGYALFGGGELEDPTAVVDAYDTSLTRTSPTRLGAARRELSATTVGGYALFAGGYSDDYHNRVDSYNTSLTMSNQTPLSVARYRLTATTLGDYALFADGWGEKRECADVDAYDTSLTRTAPTPLTHPTYWNAAVTVGDYALISGGDDYSLVWAYTVQ